MNIVDVINISKKYSSHFALNDLSFSIKEGAIFGLLGPNGAGKTTFLRILNQIILPDEGKIFYNGNALSAKDIENIGYLPEERGLYKKMEVGEQAIYLAGLKGLDKNTAKERLHYWFQKFEIDSWWKKKVEELSKGMQQKVQFITTVIHEPKLLILDEPFSGFDPINTNLLKEEVLQLKKKGTTIILSTHNMTSVEEICDDIVLINKAQKVLDGNLVEIKERFKKNQFEIELKDVHTEIPQENNLFSIISQEEKSHLTRLIIQLKNEISANLVLAQMLNMGTVIKFNELFPLMNEIFIHVVNQNYQRHEQN